MAVLYRGIPKTRHKAYTEALQGVVRPLGTSTDYEKHVRDEHVFTDVTSWTRDLAVARRFATRNGVVVEIDEAVVATMPHPLPNRYPYEQEVLVKGEVRGCRVV